MPSPFRPSLVLLSFSVLWLSSCHAGRTLIWNFGDYDDYKKFHHDTIHAGTPAPLPRAVAGLDPGRLPAGTVLGEVDLPAFLTATKTTSFLVMRRDSVVYEWYGNDYVPTQLHCVNSVSKSFLSLLIGMAMADGHIGAVTDRVDDYVTELKGKAVGALTLEQLLDMESGVRFREQYFNPFGNLAKFYYGRDLRRYLRRLTVERPPGNFNYQSVNTDLLGWVLEEALGESVVDYLERRVWRPLGMEYDATWSVDDRRRRVPKYSYGLNVRTPDLLRLGQLYLHGGRLAGAQIVPADWVARTDEIDPGPAERPNYRNHWWRDVVYRDTLPAGAADQALHHHRGEDGLEWHKIYTGNYYAAGFLGQFVYVNPATKTVVVRTGKRQGKTDWPGLFRRLSAVGEYL